MNRELNESSTDGGVQELDSDAIGQKLPTEDQQRRKQSVSPLLSSFPLPSLVSFSFSSGHRGLQCKMKRVRDDMQERYFPMLVSCQTGRG